MKKVLGSAVLAFLITVTGSVNATDITVSREDVLEARGVVRQNFEQNFFVTKKVDPLHAWLSVSHGVYNRQYYTRDSFISFIGAVEADDEIRRKLAYSLDWFGTLIQSDGYMPIWVQETDQLNVYNYCPYNLTQQTGGIKQLDHLMEYINGIYLNFQKTQDKKVLRIQLQNAEKVYSYLRKCAGKKYLLNVNYSPNAGVDWADAIRRSGRASFANAYWYQTIRQLSDLYNTLGNFDKKRELLDYAAKVKEEYNKQFWKVSVPKGCAGKKFGHYASWINQFGTFDYFEVDGNALAVAAGLADKDKTASILKEIDDRFDYYVGKNGATRVLCGYYEKNATSVSTGTYQNGGYWYIVSYYLAMALARNGSKSDLNEIQRRVTTQTLAERGLSEWYFENGQVGGASNYSWSLMFPVFLDSIMQGRNSVYKIGYPAIFTD